MAAFFALLVVLAGIASLAGAAGSTTRVISSIGALAVLTAILIVRAKDGWGIYGVLLATGFATDLLPLAPAYKLAAQIPASLVLVYLFFDRGWLSNEELRLHPSTSRPDALDRDL